ncbi:hypothetical protein CCACVL1_08421 [Corchorus capsularis]|uniref:Uncharacterized protein n=1 Tax=Corchorus capsularis TaxID=210143 RepID=A0A1R3J0S3_COCAP|nr:hypothetical protein CCACVL1_08421 [Corchorus capsularis]
MVEDFTSNPPTTTTTTSPHAVPRYPPEP